MEFVGPSFSSLTILQGGLKCSKTQIGYKPHSPGSHTTVQVSLSTVIPEHRGQVNRSRISHAWRSPFGSRVAKTFLRSCATIMSLLGQEISKGSCSNFEAKAADQVTDIEGCCFDDRLRQGTIPQGLSASGQGRKEKVLFKADLVRRSVGGSDISQTVELEGAVGFCI